MKMKPIVISSLFFCTLINLRAGMLFTKPISLDFIPNRFEKDYLPNDTSKVCYIEVRRRMMEEFEIPPQAENDEDEILIKVKKFDFSKLERQFIDNIRHLAKVDKPGLVDFIICWCVRKVIDNIIQGEPQQPTYKIKIGEETLNFPPNFKKFIKDFPRFCETLLRLIKDAKNLAMEESKDENPMKIGDSFKNLTIPANETLIEILRKLLVEVIERKYPAAIWMGGITSDVSELEEEETNPFEERAKSLTTTDDKTATINSDSVKNLNDLVRKYPLENILDNTVNHENFKKNVENLSKIIPTMDDRYTLPELALKDRLEEFTAIKTPGDRIAPIEAVLLAWFYQKGLYEPRWNGVLRLYLERVIPEFKKNFLKEIKNPRSRAHLECNNVDPDEDLSNILKAMAVRLTKTINVYDYYNRIKSFHQNGDKTDTSEEDALDNPLLIYNDKYRLVALRKKTP